MSRRRRTRERDRELDRAVRLQPCHDDHRIRVAEMIIEQIAAEQSLTGTRMTWNLTFQGFTIAGYALVATADASAPARWVVQTLIALVSVVIAYGTLRGIWASQNQRTYLRETWHKNDLSEYFPEPFSASRGSRMGRSPALLMCLVLIGMWIALIPSALLLGDPRGPMEVRLLD